MDDAVTNSLKIMGANAASWFYTLMSINLSDINTIVTIMAGVGSLGVSFVSILWIRRQTLSLAQKDREDHGPKR